MCFLRNAKRTWTPGLMYRLDLSVTGRSGLAVRCELLQRGRLAVVVEAFVRTRKSLYRLIHRRLMTSRQFTRDVSA